MKINELHLSQLPAVQLLLALGYEFLTPKEIQRERRLRESNVLLEDLLRAQLKAINRIQHKGQEFLFSEENLQTAIERLKNLPYDGLLRTNEAVYDLLTLGTALEQTVDGDTRSFTLQYVDWRHPERNRFHLAVEYSVERTRSTKTARPDLVLFVNGIPFVVIECKAPQVELEQALSQCIRNQREEYIPRLFVFSQLLLALNKNSASYATTGSAAKFWSVWKEDALSAGPELARLEALVNTPFAPDVASKVLAALDVQAWELPGERLVTEQDKALYALCRPERLLELVWKYTVFDAGVKKIARYQQYFVVKDALQRVRHFDASGSRHGGIIWHTQGSGKSLTMVMLARNLALDPGLRDPQIVLVTDREDLDKQLGNTFVACGLDAQRATSGRNLLQLLSGDKASIVTTLVHKFAKAHSARNYRNESSDIFFLVDEGHRTQYGSLSARMRQMFPKACFLGFTGTPLLKKEKNSFRKFGTLIKPQYSISQAVADGAVVPLLYEGRHAEMKQDRAAVDLWFERHTQGLSEEQRADLKRKYARAEMLNKTDRVVYMRAFDISEHFRSHWQGTGYKAQLVAPDKATALLYHTYLDEIGLVSSEVVISTPDTREGNEEVDAEPREEVQKFWQRMMTRFGTAEEYSKQLINQFKNSSHPEILIVVSKLLTGFDAPRNRVMYLCRSLREHTLLQAIARVNRLHEEKDYGLIVDYVGSLGELDSALTMYSEFEEYDEADLIGTLIPIRAETEKLPLRHSALWELFKTVRHTRDEEAYEQLLADDELRDEFYLRLSEFGRCLSVALASERFLEETEDRIVAGYKADFRYFDLLRRSVRQRYAEAVDYREYEPKIRKLLDTHIQADEVVQLNEPVNIFNEQEFLKVKEEQSIWGERERSRASKADSIAHATKKAISEHLEEDPAFYEKFSQLIQQVIDDFRKKRITDLEYLNQAIDIRNRVVRREHDDTPASLAGNEDAMAYYGVVHELLTKAGVADTECEKHAADIALAAQEILSQHWKIHFWDDEDEQKLVINAIDDYLYDEIKTKRGVELSLDTMDRILERVLQVARHRIQ